jgi:hypothetical protein
MLALSKQQPLSHMQMELMKLYSAGVPDQYLAEIKEMIARFLLAKAREEADIIWKEKKYTEETTQQWLRGE